MKLEVKKINLKVVHQLHNRDLASDLVTDKCFELTLKGYVGDDPAYDGLYAIDSETQTYWYDDFLSFDHDCMLLNKQSMILNIETPILAVKGMDSWIRTFWEIASEVSDLWTIDSLEQKKSAVIAEYWDIGESWAIERLCIHLANDFEQIHDVRMWQGDFHTILYYYLFYKLKYANREI